MTTAQTVQLLDANNNNISPAVCIDSIYYEGSVDNATYRYALREKFIVGGNIVSGKPQISHASRDTLEIPYIYAESGQSSVWKLSTDKLNIASNVKDFIGIICDSSYAKITDVSSDFLDLKGKNVMDGSISMNGRVFVSSTGIEDSFGDKLTLNNSIAKLDGKNELIITSPSVKISGADVSIGSTEPNSNTHIHGHELLLQSQTNVSIGTAQNLSIITNNGDVTIDTTKGDIILDASDSLGNILLKADNISINGIKFNPPKNSDANPPHMLAVTYVENSSAVEMTWNKIGGMKLLNYHTPNSSAEFSFVDTAERNILSGVCVSFAGSSIGYTTIGRERVSDINIKSVGGQTLSGSGDISFKTIITEDASYSLIGDSSIFLVSSSTFEKLKPTVVYKDENTYDSGDICVIKLKEEDRNIKAYVSKSTASLSGGSMQAKAFVMSSDRNLKTDIREDCFAKELPAIHGFKWKDTSVQSYGFIAQELEEAGFDHLVINGRNGKGVDYMAALSYKVAQLERENQMLKQSISDLYDKLNNK